MQGNNPNDLGRSKSITRSLSKSYGGKKGKYTTRSIVWNQEIQHPDPCVNDGPDIYRSVLGPTPDESVLNALQTVMDMCRAPFKSDPQQSSASGSSTRMLDPQDVAEQDVEEWLKSELALVVDNAIQSNNKAPSVLENKEEIIEDINDFLRAKKELDDYAARTQSRASFASQARKSKTLVDRSASAIVVPIASFSYKVRKSNSCGSVNENSEPVQMKRHSSIQPDSSAAKRLCCPCLAENGPPCPCSSAQNESGSSSSSCDETVKTTIAQTVSDKATSVQFLKEQKFKKGSRTSSKNLGSPSAFENSLPKGSKYKCSADSSLESSAEISKSKCCSCQTTTTTSARPGPYGRGSVVDEVFLEPENESLSSGSEPQVFDETKPSRSIVSNCPKPTQSALKSSKTPSALPEQKFFSRSTSVSQNRLTKEQSNASYANKSLKSEAILPTSTSYKPTDPFEAQEILSKSLKGVTNPQASRAIHVPSEGVFFLPPSGVFTKQSSYVPSPEEETALPDELTPFNDSSKPVLSQMQNEPPSKSTTSVTFKSCNCVDEKSSPSGRSSLFRPSKPAVPSRTQNVSSTQQYVEEQNAEEMPSQYARGSILRSSKPSFLSRTQNLSSSQQPASGSSRPVLSRILEEPSNQPSKITQQSSYRGSVSLESPRTNTFLTCPCPQESYYDVEDPFCEPQQCSELNADCLKDSKLCIRQAQAVPDEVRYAIVRISRFPDYATYEIMKSTRAKPRVIPKTVEGIFVLKNNKKR